MFNVTIKPTKPGHIKVKDMKPGDTFKFSTDSYWLVINPQCQLKDTSLSSYVWAVCIGGRHENIGKLSYFGDDTDICSFPEVNVDATISFP